jgi:outer membrane receptor protein involved in Fe transport
MTTYAWRTRAPRLAMLIAAVAALAMPAPVICEPTAHSVPVPSSTPGSPSVFTNAAGWKAFTAPPPDTGSDVLTRTPPSHGDVLGVVADSTSGAPLPGAEVVITQNGGVVADVMTDQFGRFIAHNLPAASYRIEIHLIGYRVGAQNITVPSTGEPVRVQFRLTAAPLQMEALTVTATTPMTLDTRSGDQVYQQKDYHGAPSNPTSQILQQSIVGAARAPTGEVHIRGQHAEYTYYIDGVPVPPGIAGSLNEVFSPAVVNKIDFQTGGWDAEYGNRNAAIVNVQTRIPAGRFHTDASGYVGSFQRSGESLDASGNAGSLGWFISGSRQASGMREQPVMFDTSNDVPINFHNDGQDYYTFGKLQYVPRSGDVVNLDLNWSRTHFQVPFDSLTGIIDDHQTDVNSFANLSWRHQFDAADRVGENGSDLFAAVYARHGGLDYVPGATDQPSFVFYPDTTPVNVREARSFDVYGTKVDFRWRPGHDAAFKTGVEASATTGREDFTTADAFGNPGPASQSSLNGHDVGVYAQTVLTPVEWFELRTGLRYDTHTAPFTTAQHQVSPRVKLSFYPGHGNTVYLYYGRLFMPTNVENLRAITTVSQAGDTTAASPTLPERDNFFEAGVIRRFPAGLVVKLDGYLKNSAPGIDDNTVPGSAVTTDVNIAEVKVRGIEAAIDVKPQGSPVTGYVNFAVSHAYGHGPVTGGFFPTDIANVPGGWFDLDHDQRISAVANAVYSAHRTFLSLTGIYGSGLTNGADITQPIGRGLFDFNSAIHVRPNFILDGAAGRTFVIGHTVVSPQVYVNNILDNHYLLKGAFFSGAAVGRPRSLELRVNIGY